MFSILLVLLVIVSVLMIGLILLQKSEGSGLSGSSAASVFGGALTGAAAGNFLTRATAILATAFFVLCAMLAILASNSDMATQQSELRRELQQKEYVAPAVEVEDTMDANEILESVGANPVSIEQPSVQPETSDEVAE